ncbi:MAG: MetQ/NlpA family ABC transporter substrate-binding protein [Chloroflexota bacterium]|jgi:NitT/TauT family transport system substrate-binding protein
MLMEHKGQNTHGQGRRWGPIALLVLLAGLLAACSGQSEPTTIRLAVLPILDALPMYVAQEQGYFEDEDLVVEFIPVTSAAERDQVIQAGRADGMINEILSTLFYNNEQPEVTIVRYARIPTPDFPQFYILSSANSGIMSVDDLKGQDIGISEGTIIEYSTDRLLQAEGLTSDEISTIAVPRIPDRMALLSSGELPAANLPDPLATLAIQGGAHIIVDDSKYPEYGHSTISFRNEFVEENGDALRGFLAALERAVGNINQDKEQFSGLLTERSLVPEPLVGSFTVPDFPTASVPPISQWDDVVDWALQKDYIETQLVYDDSVDGSYLP